MKRRSRQVALATAGAALLLLAAAGAALADGGPHQMSVNNGTSGINGDCASCHRAHTAEAADLLTADMPTLCTNCHNGTKATTDVVDGVQYTPTGIGGSFQQTTTLGALRGGGFSYALIDSGNAARYAYAFGQNTRFSGHVGVLGAGQKVTSTHSGAGTVWGNGDVANGAGAAGVTLDCAKCHNPHGNGQYRILNTEPGEDWSAPFAVTNAGGVEVTEVGPVVLTGLQVRNYTVLPSTSGLTSGIVGTPAQGDYWRYKFDPAGVTNWLTLSNSPDQMNRGWDGSTPVNAASIATKTTLSSAINAGQTAITVASAVGFPSSGQFVVRIDRELMQITAGAGTRNWTVTRGYNGSTATAHGTTEMVYQPLQNTSGLMTAWCLQCHTRYNGLPSLVIDPNTGLPDVFPSSVVAMDPTEPIFKFKHGTTNVGCQQCHVSHGSNAVLWANGVSGMDDPAGNVPPTVPGAGTGSATSADSRLLKIDNLGTCNMCHDPTNTLTPRPTRDRSPRRACSQGLLRHPSRSAARRAIEPRAHRPADGARGSSVSRGPACGLGC
ncbi:MAG: cytochrome c3 family protein [Chloroflexota bacterium]